MLSLAVASTGCVSAPPRDPLPLQSAPSFSSNSGAQRLARWWEAFEDPSLDKEVRKGLESNFTLRAAFERLRAARAIARQEESALWPTVDGALSGSLRDGDEIDREQQLGLGLEASYELDLWGRVRASVRAERLEASATAEDYQAAAVSLSAEIATVVYRLTESRAQLALIDSQLKTNGDVLRVLLFRFGVGQSGSADVLRQRQLVAATEEQRILESATVELLEHQLAVLQGEAPQGLRSSSPPSALPNLPGLPEVGLPAELLRRRPDTRAAFLRLESSDAFVAAAVRDQYPRIDLSASVATTGETASDLFSSWIGVLAGQIVAPLFDGGLRRQEVERAVAVRRQRLAEYGQVVLGAFREVEDALALERRQTERITSLERQLELANSTYRELRNQYLNGAADFLEVLIALRGQQGLERSLLEARLLRIESRIALHRALAGGLEQPPYDEATDAEEDMESDEARGRP